MSAQKKYYWIKLKDSFMNSDKVDYLMSQKDGANYIVLYQMLCLRTINTEGEFARQIGEVLIPYDAEKIQRDCKYFSIDTVREALRLYMALGMIYEQENGILKITEFDNLVGCDSSWAIQRKNYREKQTMSAKCLLNVCQSEADIVDQEIRDKDIRDKDIRDKKIEKENKKKHKEIFFENSALNSAFLDFVEARKKLKKPMTDRAIELSVQRLKDLASEEMPFSNELVFNEEKAIKIVDKAIVKGWLTFYELKEEDEAKKPDKKDKGFDLIDAWVKGEV